MRTVVSSREVAVLWANQSQYHARNASKNIYFYDSVIYSYGSHFPIARYVCRAGTRLVLFNCRTYSVSTSRHQSYVRAAIGGNRRLCVPNLFCDLEQHCSSASGHGPNLDWFAERIAALAARLRKSRVSPRYLVNNLDYWVTDGNAYAEFFGLATRFDWPLGLCREELLVRADYWEARRDALYKQRRIEAQARWEAAQVARKSFIETYKVKVALWRDGARIELPDMPYELRHVESVALRLCWPRVQTSIGVYADIADVVCLLECVRAGRDKEWSYEWVDGEYVDLGKNAPKFSPYAAVRVDADGRVTLSSGHFILREEIERVGILLGLLPENAEPPAWYTLLLTNRALPSSAGRQLKRRRRTIRLFEEEDDRERRTF